MNFESVLDAARRLPGTSERIKIYDPSTGEQLTDFADGGAAAVDNAVAKARAAFRSGVWHQTHGSHRAKVLWRIAELFEKYSEEIAEFDSRNVGMSRMAGRYVAHACADLFRYYAGWCTKVDGVAFELTGAAGISGVPAGMHAYTIKEPFGVVGIIIPWNGPAYNAAVKLAPALAAGCSCVLKPAEETPLSAILIEKILKEAGVPDGVVNIVYGYGHTVGAAIAAHPGIDKVAFTGSTEVGKLIVQAATGNLKKVLLELGGKSPVLIYDDADLSKAIPGAARGIFSGAGQGCICGSRIYVHRKVYEQVVDGLTNIAKSMRLGGSTEENVDMGPLVSQKQLTRVMKYINEGKSGGVEVTTGGNQLDRPGYFVQPTVLTKVNPDLRLFREEIFGPVVAVQSFDDDEQVIAAANNTTYGLAASAWTRDVSRAHSLARRLEAGTVTINCQLAWDSAVPMGGHKQSGWGAEYGRDGIESYMQSKAVFSQL